MNKLVRSVLAATPPRSPHVPLALSLAVAAVLVASSAQAQINFTIPSDAPDGSFGTVGILEVTGNGNIGSQGDARSSLSSMTGTRKTGNSSSVDFFSTDAAARGHYPFDNPFVSDPTPTPNDGVSDDIGNIAVLYRGTVHIDNPGEYTFGVNSDDGFTLAFDNGQSPFTAITATGGNDASLQTFNGGTNGAFQYLGGRGATDSLATITLAAGNHPFLLTYHEGGGGAGVELFSAFGSKNTFDNTFGLVGQGAFTRPGKPSIGTVGTWDYVGLNSASDLANAISKYNNNAPNSAVDSQGNARTPVTDFTRTQEPTIAFADPQGANNGGRPTRAFPNDNQAANSPNGDDNFFGGAGRVSLTITQAGRYTFDVLSDDSFRFRIFAPGSLTTAVPIFSSNGPNGLQVSNVDTDGDTVPDAFQSSTCCSDGLGRYDLAAGTYTLEAIFQEGGGGSGFQVFGAPGEYFSYDQNVFSLVGETSAPVQFAGGLALVPEPTSALLLGLGGLALLRRRRQG